tara:strand:- start:15815 stop:17899 length:2085 start_codon:yes stop_codon:yes gene_type:complete
MPDYKKNPIFHSDINRIQSHEPNITFGYSWDDVSGKWIPTAKDITVDMRSTNAILEGISGELSNIHVDVEIDSDKRSHELLESISGSLEAVGMVDDANTHRLLSGISGQLSGIHVDVEIDSDTRSHELLEEISNSVSSLSKVDDETTHSLLSGISGELSEIHVDVAIDHDTRAHELLEEISNSVSSLSKVDDETTHSLLSGISGELSEIHVDVAIDHDTRSHELLESIKDGISNLGDSNDETTHELLREISEELSKIHVDVEIDHDVRSHELLESISGGIGSLGDSSDAETHRLLQEISNELSNIHVDVELDHDTQTHQLLDQINENLKLIDVNIIGNNLSDTETHRILSGISGHDDCHYRQNQRMLGAIKDASENLNLSVEELKKDFREVTYHKKVFEKHVLMPEQSPTQPPQAPLSFEEKIFKLRKDRQNSEYLFMKESYDGVDRDRVEDMEESMEFAIYGEKYVGDDADWHSFFPLAKRLGNSDRINLFNNDIYPLEIKFQGGDSTWIDPGYKVEMSKEEASQLFIRNQFAISKFEVEYSLQRLYTPEEQFTRNDEHEYTLGHQTYGRVGLTSMAISESFLYVKYLNKWKRVAIASWQDIDTRTQHAFPISYFDAYSDVNYLYLNTNEGERRVLIADWETTDKIPIDSHNKIWADNDFIYAKLPSRLDAICEDRLGHSSWKRYPITIFSKS